MNALKNTEAITEIKNRGRIAGLLAIAGVMAVLALGCRAGGGLPLEPFENDDRFERVSGGRVPNGGSPATWNGDSIAYVVYRARTPGESAIRVMETRFADRGWEVRRSDIVTESFNAKKDERCILVVDLKFDVFEHFISSDNSSVKGAKEELNPDESLVILRDDPYRPCLPE